MTAPITRTVPIEALRYPTLVEYGGKVYRAWKRLPIAELGGTILLATDERERQHALIYPNPKAPVLVVAT